MTIASSVTQENKRTYGANGVVRTPFVVFEVTRPLFIQLSLSEVHLIHIVHVDTCVFYFSRPM